MRPIFQLMCGRCCNPFSVCLYSRLLSTGDSGKVTTVVATPGQGPDRPQEVSYTDIKVIGNGSFGVVYQARLIDSQEMVAIKKVLQDKRFKVDEPRPFWMFTAQWRFSYVGQDPSCTAKGYGWR